MLTKLKNFVTENDKWGHPIALSYNGQRNTYKQFYSGFSNILLNITILTFTGYLLS